ncbi:GNAT family N-acetyltransferase [Xanthocytophaga agilis]|uniref:GNAT family N-acetyltransferase n=1 Tax=Xanthocytophaga agilis TaxID=3048010 RepID=A0AAE3QVZ3_9BACT|nr:GNAT family N-acetyltransferase [Xanthocytophaga agilis]MDJ1499004.1 GNAT family N-acetyltransferase [Xanthocytophaga agilis]
MELQLPPYKEYPIVSNERILLRQIKSEEIKDILEISFYDGKRASTIEEASAMLQKIDVDYQDGTSIHWGIFDKLTTILVGTCGYYRGFADATGELGCILRPAYYGKGYMTSALQLAIGFGKEQMGLKKIIAITTKHNNPALHLLNRLSFVKTQDLMGDDVEYEFIIRKSD